jgi:hypothetical protein
MIVTDIWLLSVWEDIAFFSKKAPMAAKVNGMHW